MIKVESDFIFHNVGQGLFYSGKINLSNSTFRFVYDCGSEKAELIEAAVKRFRKDTEDNTINLLIISHFHYDHTSGLNKLLSNFKVCDVILPYFSPVERLLIALKGPNLPPWYFRFLSDPVKFLIEKGANRIIIIGGIEGNKSEMKLYDSKNLKDYSSLKLNIKKLINDEKLLKKIKEQDRKWIKHIKSKNLLVKNHNEHATTLGIWIFRFFNYKIRSKEIGKFSECLKRKGIDTKNLQAVIKSKTKLKRLKECYKNIAKSLNNDFNNTSLVTYHGPLDIINAKVDIYSQCFPTCCYCLHHRNLCVDRFCGKEFGQMLTGDINLNFKYDEMIDHYSYYLNKIKITQIPHHGAWRNWNNDIISKKQLPKSDFWVVSAGLNNKYGHPSRKVIKEILCKKKGCYWINELNYIQIRSSINISDDR